MLMFFRKTGLMTFLSLLLWAGPSNAQYFDYSRYPPIQHAVPFHQQQTMVWCWVAAAKMVAEFYGRQPVPDQCSMLQMQYGAPCCQNPQLCARAGNITEIQALIARFGGHFSSISPPANGFILYDALRRGPIVMHTRQGGGHFVVATGMRIVSSPMGPLGVVSVNDPFYGRYEVDFPTLMQAWTAALVVY
ncbi:papain-like cysteine protease family protein [Achromobacter veterisilvae]|uniref:papain-like cysteine protease family protein n=1 Tax=Achromobacter veterisilvae TaxID=2069367 RepID=UPI00100E0EAB|nr:papain-like cysteine protease family protein [Achromobacter veterisilvae]